MIYLRSVLAQNLKNHRKLLGLTQEALAEKVDTSSTYISTIESERRSPSFHMVERIAEILKIEALELFSLKNYPPKSTSQIRNDLLNQFDQFLLAASKKIEEKKR